MKYDPLDFFISMDRYNNDLLVVLREYYTYRLDDYEKIIIERFPKSGEHDYEYGVAWRTEMSRQFKEHAFFTGICEKVIKKRNGVANIFHKQRTSHDIVSFHNRLHADLKWAKIHAPQAQTLSGGVIAMHIIWALKHTIEKFHRTKWETK